MSKFGHDKEENRNDVRDVQCKSVQRKNGKECCSRSEIDEVEKHDDKGDKHEGVERNSQTRIDLECQYGIWKVRFQPTLAKKVEKGRPLSRAKAQVSRETDARVLNIAMMPRKTRSDINAVVPPFDPVAAYRISMIGYT